MRIQFGNWGSRLRITVDKGLVQRSGSVLDRVGG